MKNLKNNKNGITLISLVITIIVLLILAGIATYSGSKIIKTANLTSFTTQMKIMQTQVNELYQKYKDNGKVKIDETTYYGKENNNGAEKTILQIGGDLENEHKKLLERLSNDESSGVKISSIEGYKYWNKDLIEDLQIEGIDREFLVNISERSIVSCEGLKYDDSIYYTLEQLPNNLYNVPYNEKNTHPTFSISKEQLSDGKWKINISDIEYETGYINKWYIMYKLNEEEKWNTTEDLNFIVTKKGVYNIKIVNDNYESDEQKVYIETPIDAPEGDGQQFSRANGKIDIQFLKGTSYNIGQANPPKIESKDMIPVNWNGINWVVTDEKGWDYNYGETSETKKWANIMLKDTLELDGMDNDTVQSATIEDMKGKTVTKEGSMFVWIPRYAYKITYYNNSSKEEGTEIGYSDARGLVDKQGKTPTGMSEPVTSIAVEDNYRPHPAFEDNNSTNSQEEYSQGEWSTKLTGIWVGKFETTEKVNEKITIGSNKDSYVSQTIGTFYTDAQNLNIANSHMAKNSEWGAMAYLTESKYGRNGTQITKNESKIAGAGNYQTNILQSTTENIYGIYDTVGGAYECTAGYISDSSQSYGNSFASTDDSTNNKELSTKYSTVYNKIENNSSPSENYNSNINKVFGDGIIETSTQGTGANSWDSAQSDFVGLSSSSNNENLPFFSRGGHINSSYSGMLYFSSSSGMENNQEGFRVCLIVE